MSDKDLFWDAFSDELEKTGNIGMLANLGKFFGRAKQMATPWVAKAKQVATPWADKGVKYIGGTRAGQYIAKSPRLAKFLGFAGVQAGIGATSELGMMPFTPRRQIIEIAPKPHWTHYQQGGRR